MPLLIVGLVIIVIIVIIYAINVKKYRELESAVLTELNFSDWDIISFIDEKVVVKSRQSLEKYDSIKFFKDNREKLDSAKNILKRKSEVSNILSEFLNDNKYKQHSQYNNLVEQINKVIKNAEYYRIRITYISSAGNNLGTKIIAIDQDYINSLDENPSLLMGKGEYSKYIKEQEKELLNKKQHEYYEHVNAIIDYANQNKNLLVLKGSKEDVDDLITQLFDRTINSIKKIKSVNSEEWDIIEKFITQIETGVKNVVDKNQKILNYYDSPAFLKIKEACEVLMGTQREFNEYIIKKVDSISQLFGTRVVRNETINEDEYQYIRPYKKTITPFSAEVSAAVFSSAENNPIEYVIKNFYPNKSLYPEQIQKLHLLVEELATLKEAKKIIENYKQKYQQYIDEVPDYVLKEDEAGFYSRLGFAHIDESSLVVEYSFSYTSGGGMAKRKFSVPMTEENILELIKTLEEKLTLSAFTKEQRALMTSKLRETIKKRDNYTCCICGNSIYAEQNLLLEIDHIIPISKGGCTVEDNLQTLCWKCNRAKGNKLCD